MYTCIVKLAKIFNKIGESRSSQFGRFQAITINSITISPRRTGLLVTSKARTQKAGNNSKNFQWTSERRQIPLVWIWNGFPSCKLLGETPMWPHICSSSHLLHCYLATPKTGAAHMFSTPPRLLIKPIFESTGVQIARLRCRDSCIYLEIVFPWCDSTLSGSQILNNLSYHQKINK